MNSLGTIDKLLVSTVIFSMVISFAIPLPSSLTKPGFSSFVLLADPSFAVPYLVCLLAVGILWSRQGERLTVALFITVVFSILTLDLWEVKAPGGGLLFSGSSYGSIVIAMLQSGHLNFVAWGNYPGLFMLGGFFGSTTGLPLRSALLVLDTLRSALIGLFYFLVIGSFSKSYKLTATFTMLSIIGSEELIKDPPFNVSSYGLLFFLIIMTLIVSGPLNASTFPRYIFPFVIVSIASMLSYPMIPFVIMLMIVLAARVGRISISFVELLGVVSVPWLAWIVYVSRYFQVGQSFLTNVLTLLLGSNGASSSPTSSHPFGYYLSQLLISSQSALPYNIGYLLPAWFLGFFGIGILVWAISKLFHLARVPHAFIVVALLMTALLILLSNFPSGTGWPRILPYMAPFIGATMLTIFSRQRPLYYGIVISLVLLLALPTVIADTSSVGTSGATFQWETSTGNFLASHMTGGTVYFGEVISTLDYNLNSRLMPLIPSVALTPGESLVNTNATIKAFSESRDGSTLAISPLLYFAYTHAYGNQYLDNFTASVDNVVTTSNQIYSNAFIQLEVPL